jgi:ATP-dependent Lhr-like helicase
LPFWHGDTLGRPAELGKAIGAFTREVDALDDEQATARVSSVGLDPWATNNLITYLREQRLACGHLPDDRTIVIERFRDEIGDWRLVIHSPLGGRVNTPWSLAVAARIRDDMGVDVQVMPSDDGIVMRLPDIDSADDAPPSVLDYLVFDGDEIERVVTSAVAGSALFAARFRECAARALLLPRRRPDRRTPLWQQRQRSAQLLAVAGEHAQFPIVLETMRECLKDVFDVPALRSLMQDIEHGTVRVVEMESSQPSPFARSLLFSYVGAFLYEGDAPLAERRAQALALDSTLLAELLGQAELRELLDIAALEQVERELQRLTPERAAKDPEDAADVLRLVGPLTTHDAADRGIEHGWLTELAERRRVVETRIAGRACWAAVEDVGRLRDALGVPPPMGIADAFLEPVADPVGDLVSRYARTHGPFRVAEAAAALGLGPAVVASSLEHFATVGRVVSGEFRPGGSGTEWCDADVLRQIRRRSLALLRHEVEPVPPATLGRFLPGWQDVGGGLRGAEGAMRVVEQLQGVCVPASILESLLLPARVSDYSPAMLDELLAAGEVRWAGRGALPRQDGWVALTLADQAPLLLPFPDADAVATDLHRALLLALDGDNALFFRTLADRTGCTDDHVLAAALWDLVWAGQLSNDTLTPLRAYRMLTRSAQGRGTVRRPRYGRPGRLPAPLRMQARTGLPHTAGRWSLLPPREPDATIRAHALGQALLDRYGVVTRGAVMAERPPGGFAATYRVLAAMEETGRTRRGYFVEGLGAAQFGHGVAIDRLRAVPEQTKPRTFVLAATDPANPYGAALPWPARPVETSGHQPGRKAGAVVVLVDGELAVYVERGGRTLLTWLDDDRIPLAVEGLANAVRRGWLGKLTVERTDGSTVFDSPISRALQDAGFRLTPRGLRLSPRP